MTKLDFLEVNRNFRSYYKTLRDVNYHLNNSELDQENIDAATKAMTKLIYDFIRTEGATFKEMEEEKYVKKFKMFENDFLSAIENSGINNVDFDEFAGLLDELLSIANHRTTALQKIKTTKQEIIINNEADESQENEVENEVVLEVQVQYEELVESNETIEEVEETVIEQLTEDHELLVESRDDTFESNDVFHYRPARRRFR